MTTQTQNRERRGESTYHTRAVSRACRILTSFTVSDFELSIGDLHERLGIHKSTLVRLLRCLADEGFIEQNPQTDRYRLGIKAFEIGSLYYRARMRHIETVAHPQMQRLVDDFNLSSNLAIRDGSEIVYIAAVEPKGRPLRMVYSVGDRFGVHHTSLGKALIAFLSPSELEEAIKGELAPLTPRTITTTGQMVQELEQVRLRGYATDDEESMPGLRCIGAPIWNMGGVVAALSVSGSTLIVTRERIDEIAQRVVEGAASVSAQLGGFPPSPE